MDFNKLSKAIGSGIGTGLATGFGVLAGINIIGMPVSYVANRFIYHHKAMRSLLCIVTAMLSIPLYLYMLLFGNTLHKVHYFGYMPFLMKDDDVDTKSEEMGWFEPLIKPIWNWIRDTLLGGFVDHRELPDDKMAYNTATEFMLLPFEQKGTAGTISEKAVRLALQAAAAPTKEQANQLEEQQMEVIKNMPPVALIP